MTAGKKRPAISAGLFVVVSVYSNLSEIRAWADQAGEQGQAVRGAVVALEGFILRMKNGRGDFDLHDLANAAWASRILWSERISWEEIPEHELKASEAEYLRHLVAVTHLTTRMRFGVLDAPPEPKGKMTLGELLSQKTGHDRA